MALLVEIVRGFRMGLPIISPSLAFRVERDMNTKGYSLVDTSEFLVGKEWPDQRSKTFRILKSKDSGFYLSLNECCADWIVELVKWQGRLLKKALTRECFHIGYNHLSLRNERFKYNRKDETCRWHTDGPYLRSLCVVKGETTLIMTDLGKSHVPLGWTVFITGNRRHNILPKIPPTLHCRPKSGALRRIIVNGWVYGYDS